MCYCFFLPFCPFFFFLVYLLFFTLFLPFFVPFGSFLPIFPQILLDLCVDKPTRGIEPVTINVHFFKSSQKRVQYYKKPTNGLGSNKPHARVRARAHSKHKSAYTLKASVSTQMSAKMDDNDYNTPVIEEIVVKNKKKRPKFIRIVPCKVCGSDANDHLHYGSIVCYSCRAFFRRIGQVSH